MNFPRLQQTRIHDLAPVYGGARGSTLSSRQLAYARRALQEAGVTPIIDLREKDKTTTKEHHHTTIQLRLKKTVKQSPL